MTVVTQIKTGSGTVNPDKRLASEFLTTLDESADFFTFQTFDDLKSRADKNLARILHGDIESCWRELCQLSSRGAGVFVTVNETDGRGRKLENMITVRTVFQEADRSGVPIPKLEPHLVVESSPGKFHRYWLVDGGTDFERFAQTQARLVRDFGSDPNAKDLARVLRLPGFPHQKDPDNPWLVRVVEDSGSVSSYSWADIAVAIPPFVEVRHPSIDLPPSHLDDGPKLRSALAAIDPDCEYMDWLRIGMALHRESGGSATGLDLWDSWSRGDLWQDKSISYRPGHCAYKWNGFGNYNGIPVLKATIFKMATDTGWRWRDKPKSANKDSENIEPSSISERFNLTDCGNAERLVHNFGNELRYCHDWQRWLIWDGQRWLIDRAGGIIRFTRDTARRVLVEAADHDDRDTRREFVKHSFRSESRERQNAMAALAQSDLAISPEALDPHPWLLNCRNGTINLRTGILQAANKDDFITKMVPIDYSNSAECPLWEDFLNRIFEGNEELMRFVQQATGYSLTGSTQEQCVFILHGSGRNGKSTLLETLAAMLGSDFAQQAAPDLLMQRKYEAHPTELAELRGARLVTAVESGEGRRLNEPLLKQMSGGDRMRARFMRADFFEFRPVFKLWLATNHKPEIRGTDLGIWRRIRLIPFNVQIPPEDVDPELPAKLADELPGILAWAVRGCLDWHRSGRLEAPAVVAAATTRYRTEQDVLAAFLADCCITGPDCKSSAASLYTAYTAWCEHGGEIAEKQRKFGDRLSERGFDPYLGTGGYRWWRGIGLKDDRN